MFEPSTVLLENLPFIEHVIARACSRYRMTREEADEFGGYARLRLLDNDYAIIRAFSERSSFRTYLTVVIHRLLLDYRIQQGGKWRPSAIAKRFGDVGIELERLIHRQEWTLAEAVDTILRTHPELTRDDVEAIAERLPTRERRSFVPIDQVQDIAADEVVGPEAVESAETISKIVTTLVHHLPEEDKLVLQLRFWVGLTVSQIAQALGLDQQAVFRRLYRLFAQFRHELERAGVVSRDAEALIGSDAIRLDFGLRDTSQERQVTVTNTRDREIPATDSPSST